MYELAIVIPCWNEEKVLPEMLDCLLKQTFQNWHAFCVDDQSTDGTAEVIMSYQAKDERIQYICRDREPKGGQMCRNIGIEKSQGAKYLVFLDADDLIAPYCFEQRVRFMDKHPELDCGVFPILAFSEDIHEEYGPVFGVKTFEDDLQAMLNFNLPFAATTNIYRYDKLIEHELYWDCKIKSYQDADYNIRFLLSGMSYAFAENAKADYFYRVGRDGVANKIKSRQHYDSHIYFIDKVTQSVSNKYGDKYDFYLEAMITDFLGTFQKAWKPYFQLLRLLWMQHRWGFKLRLVLYLMILKKDRRLLFYKYRKYAKRQNAIWAESMAKKRKEMLEKGVEV